MVHFVSAGPGAVDLITVRGKRLLETADVVIYAGSLVNPELLKYTKKGCRIYNSAQMDLQDVLEVIKEAEKAGRMTVRLHTGDTSVYSTIREQMEELDREGIGYDVTPGVSAFQAAAAALDAELTLPGISQSVILTRGNGRTKVPEKESLKSFSGHQATMVLYLSSSLASRVQSDLLTGGYSPDTPVDVVYKASWPEEKIIRSTLAEFPEKMEEEEITKTALILIGNVLSERPAEHVEGKSGEGRKREENKDENNEKNGSEAGNGINTEIKKVQKNEVPRSKLYDPSFSTGVRKGKIRHIWMVSCTRNGTEKMRELKQKWEEKAKEDHIETEFELHVKCAAMKENETRSLRLLTKEAFDLSDVMIFFSSTGIAVRSIAPFLKSKMTDPAVLVIDEKGKNCIPLVSGHIGGANEYAEEVGQMIGSHAIVTTATDLEHRFSVDVFAKRHNMAIPDMEKAKMLSAKVVEGRELLLYSDREEYIRDCRFPMEIRLTADLWQADLIVTADRNLIGKLSSDSKKPGIGLVLVPKIFDLGIGCRRNTLWEEMKTAIDTALESLHTVSEAIHGIGSIELKKDEPAFTHIEREYHVAPVFFSAGELRSVPGQFTGSDFVKKITGVDNVCERSAVRLSGGKLVLGKTVCGDVTVAAAVRKPVY